MWEEPGLGWAGPPPGPGPCSYVLTHASCHAWVQGPPILTFCPDIFVFLTISPCWWRSHLKQSIIVDILPWGLCSALLVVWTQGSKGAGYQQVTSQFISMLFLVTYRSISQFSGPDFQIAYTRKNIKNINHRNGQDSSAAGLYTWKNGKEVPR